jgi:hypothetical protein
MKIPTKAELSPKFAKLVALRDVLRHEHSTLRSDAQALHAKILANPSTASRNTAQDARAAEILDGKPVTEVHSDEGRLTAVNRRIGDLESAIHTLSHRIDAESGRASVMVVEKIAPHHRQLVDTVCAKLIDAHKASKAYYKLADALNEDGVAWTGMYPMHAHTVIGEPTDRYSNLAIFLRQAVSHNFIDANIVPTELRI